MAPEIMERLDINNKCDLWSIGIIIYKLFFKEYPYKGMTELAIIRNIKTSGQNCLKKSNDNKLDNLIRRLLVPDPKSRMTWEEYFNHPFFNQIIIK